MTKYERMREDMNVALKQGNKLARETIGDMVAAVGKAAVAGKHKVEITDDLVDAVLTKYLKGVQEQIDTCPETEFYAERKAKYLAQKDIVMQYAPKVMNDPVEIKNTILYWMAQMGVDTFDKKTFMPMCKQAKMDMKIVNEVIKNDL